MKGYMMLVKVISLDNKAEDVEVEVTNSITRTVQLITPNFITTENCDKLCPILWNKSLILRNLLYVADTGLSCLPQSLVHLDLGRSEPWRKQVAKYCTNLDNIMSSFTKKTNEITITSLFAWLLSGTWIAGVLTAITIGINRFDVTRVTFTAPSFFRSSSANLLSLYCSFKHWSSSVLQLLASLIVIGFVTCY